MSSMSGWRDIYEELPMLQRSDDDRFCFPFQDWWNTLSVVNIKRAVDTTPIDRLNGGREALDQNNGLQRTLYKCLLPWVHPDCFSRTLRMKLGRWFHEDSLDNIVSHARAVLEKVSKTAPPCVRYTLLCTWCNAWCTPKRFQGNAGKCKLCCECDGCDTLEHYAECPFQWQFADRRLNLLRGSHSLLRFMALDPQHFSEVELQVCHIYAVKRAVDISRRRVIHGGTDVLRRLLWDQHKVVALHSYSMRRVYSRRWMVGSRPSSV